MKEDNPGWHKAEPVERVYIKYYPNNNFPTHEAIFCNHRYKEFKAMSSYVCVTNEAKHNMNPSQREIFRWHFRLGHNGFQHVQWLICTGRLKVQGNFKAVANFESPKCASCEFGKCHHRSNKVNTIENNPMKDLLKK